MAQFNPNLTRILTRDEIALAVEDLDRRAERSANAQVNRAVFRLATFCGLRASEIAALQLRDLHLAASTPVVLVKGGKGDKDRTVPVLYRDALRDLQDWKAERKAMGAKPSDPFVCTMATGSKGNPLHRTAIRNRFRNACKVLGDERLSRLTTHDGRHTFASWAVEEHGVVKAKQWLGHSSIHTTNTYAHAVTEDAMRDTFGADDDDAQADDAIAAIEVQLLQLQEALSKLKA